MILVTGATGQVGREVVRALDDRGVICRVLVRAGDKKLGPPRKNVEVATGDFEDAESLDAAMYGIHRVFVVCSPTEKLPALEGHVYEAARRAKVELVVKSSILGADPQQIPFRAIQAAAEQALRATGLRHVVLRPNYFMQNVIGAAKAMCTTGVYEDAAWGARLSMTDLRDVGDAAAAVLVGHGHHAHHAETYTLTGPAALSGADVARAVSSITGKPVKAMDLDPAEQRRRFATYGVPEWTNAALESLYRDYRASGESGYAAAVTDDVARLTGHPARALADLIRENVAMFA
jgi:uncharacterized protein YbjT (DUF2867 family)